MMARKVHFQRRCSASWYLNAGGVLCCIGIILGWTINRFLPHYLAFECAYRFVTCKLQKECRERLSNFSEHIACCYITEPLAQPYVILHFSFRTHQIRSTPRRYCKSRQVSYAASQVRLHGPTKQLLLPGRAGSKYDSFAKNFRHIIMPVGLSCCYRKCCDHWKRYLSAVGFSDATTSHTAYRIGKGKTWTTLLSKSVRLDSHCVH